MNSIIILIVDDDENLCNYLKKFLIVLGCQIEIALTLADGLRLMETLKPTPSFIFLDLHFPETLNNPKVTAEEALASIQKFYAINPQASIVVITGLLDDKVQQMANTLGAAFRQKPSLRSQEDVLKSLEDAIEQAKKIGIQPYEVTTKLLTRINELRLSSIQTTSQTC